MIKDLGQSQSISGVKFEAGTFKYKIWSLPTLPQFSTVKEQKILCFCMESNIGLLALSESHTDCVGLTLFHVS